MSALFINTVFAASEVALLSGGELRRVEFAGGAGSDKDELFVALSALGVRVADLDFAVVITGPGGFTGIRAGLALAKGMTIGAAVRVVPLSVFEAGVICGAGDGELRIPSTGGEVFSTMIKDGIDLENYEIKKGEPNLPPLDAGRILEFVSGFTLAVQAPLEPLYIRPHYAKAP
ncbi:MAG: hypothetical protein FWD15_06385 [Alphaproteobacteria bacterium]|nr:hypothetical protein [Alphaproteobacteria bacterium]